MSDGVLGNLVEFNPADGDAHHLAFQGSSQVPSNGLTLPVRVGGKVEFGGLLGLAP